MKKTLASLLASALIIAAPGLPAYAGVASISVNVPTADAGAGAQAAAVRLGIGGTPLQTGSLDASRFSLQTTLPGLGTPVIKAAPGAASPVVPAGAATPIMAAPSGAPQAALPAAVESAPRTAPQAAPQEGGQGAPSLGRLLEQRDELQLSPGKAASLADGDARDAGERIMDRVLGVRSIEGRSADAVAGAETPPGSSQLSPASGQSALQPAQAPSQVPSPAPAGRTGRRVLGFFTSVLRVAGAGAAVLGLQHLAVILLPAVFGFLPAAAVWAVSSGVLLLPAALYARYRLSLRDSPRLTKIKWLLDLSIGAYLGAAAMAVPGLTALTAAHFAAASLPLAGLAAGRFMTNSPLANSLLTWGSLAFLPVFLGAGAAGTLALGSLLGMLALPAMTSVAFFLGRLIYSAESGRPFSVPGSGAQKLRFPSFNWVMTGVVFALLTGYGAVYSNIAFGAWQFLGGREPAKWDSSRPFWRNLMDFVLNFNTLYLGLLAFTAATSFTHPLTFIVLAFSAERAAHWVERLLGRLLPKAAPAPSAEAKPATNPDLKAAEPKAWPNYLYRFKTAAIILSMAAIGVGMAAGVFGFMSLGKNLLIAGAIMGAQVLLSTWIIKKVMKAEPADEAREPEFFAIVRDLRERINADRAAHGKKPIPMPEMVITPLGVPNAFATGRSPNKAMVGVTPEIMDMLLNPDSLRESLPALIKASDPAGKPFKAFRKAIVKTLPGVPAEASPAELLAAVTNASDADLKKLGYGALRGVLAHEMSHVMDRHMLLGAVSGAVSSAVAFASYSVMWAVGHAKAAVQKLWDRLTGRKPDNRQYVAPFATGAGLASLLGLLKVFAALWVPLVLQIMSMGASRSNEGMADEDGAKLSAEPESLALALGLLMTWRPGPRYAFSQARLPILVALSHLMTVNPVEQIHRAGALKLDEAMEWAVGKKDDFLFNLFITHPDTNQRISRLHEMSEALDAAAKAPGR